MTSTTMHDGRVVLHQADCRDVLRSLADNSIDSVVTDPPYALVSIQKRFANSPRSETTENQANPYGRTGRGFMGQKWDNGETAFSEEFWAEVLRVLKPGGHVVAFSGTRTYHRMAVAIEDAGFEIRDQLGWVYGSGFPKSHNQHGEWEGWGTALKPAWEPICLARKALAGTVAGNLAEWGVGAINVDGCRVEADNDEDRSRPTRTANAILGGGKGTNLTASEHNSLGRWPANIIHDGSEEVLAAFPDAPGQQRAVGPEHGTKDSKGIYGDFGAREHFAPRIELDKSAARFFYAAKASRADRDAGLEGKNIHPTVKPTNLMSWLCRLVTPPGGVILDPFLGSGSTGKSAVLEGFRFVGCEREEEYIPLAISRIAWAVGSVSTPDEQKKPEAKLPANDNSVSDLFSDGQAAIGKVTA